MVRYHLHNFHNDHNYCSIFLRKSRGEDENTLELLAVTKFLAFFALFSDNFPERCVDLRRSRRWKCNRSFACWIVKCRGQTLRINKFERHLLLFVNRLFRSVSAASSMIPRQTESTHQDITKMLLSLPCTFANSARLMYQQHTVDVSSSSRYC
jgi:hypothetical protein